MSKSSIRVLYDEINYRSQKPKPKSQINYSRTTEPKKKPKCSVQWKRNTIRSSTDALGNRQNKCFTFFLFCSAKIFKWKIFSLVWEGQMVIKNNTLPVHTLFLIVGTFFSIIHKLSCLPTFYVFPVKGCVLSQKYFISHLLDNAKKILQFSE